MKQCRECGTLSPYEKVFCCICGKRYPELAEEFKKIQLLDYRNKLVVVLRAVIAYKTNGFLSGIQFFFRQNQ